MHFVTDTVRARQTQIPTANIARASYIGDCGARFPGGRMRIRTANRLRCGGIHWVEVGKGTTNAVVNGASRESQGALAECTGMRSNAKMMGKGKRLAGF
jgi:hypothetical protein